jgi:hypothetical protein
MGKNVETFAQIKMLLQRILQNFYQFDIKN